MLIIQNGCVIREYCLKFVLLYYRNYGVANHITQLCISLCKPFSKFHFDSSLCVIEIQNCIGTVREVEPFCRCVLSIEIHCFCSINSSYYKITQSSFFFAPESTTSLHMLRMQCATKPPPKFNVIFAADKRAQYNFEITMLEKSGIKVQRLNYATNGFE
ncbi:hypothetical protein PR048_015639 [Dryococelus australis]|uniref:Uncharacterized protein n=1 Tax=Dryococelus australis TaxID=614101 RepID=A0ABQ9HHH6_9NEOP|nr:hypothetical protein PR048_015639 [Dryococelus australis]